MVNNQQKKKVRRNKKIPNRQEDLYIEYLPSGKVPIISNKIVVASFDPGIVSMGIRVETWDSETGQVKPEFFGLLRCEESNSAFMKMIVFLDKEKIFDDCDMIIIEQQLKLIDELHSRYFQHIISYFMFRLKNKECVIYEISSKLKSKHFKQLQNCTKHELKSNTINLAINILEERGDIWSVNVIKNCTAKGTTQKYFKGQTDLSDAIVQIVAFFKELGILS